MNIHRITVESNFPPRKGDHTTIQLSTHALNALTKVGQSMSSAGQLVFVATSNVYFLFGTL